MSDDRDYFWVVLCKNYRFHHKGNTSYAHQIALGETDAYSSLPMLTQQVAVRCDSCGAEYAYKPSEILRNVIEIPTGFVPHPLFQEAPAETLIAHEVAQHPPADDARRVKNQPATESK